ncbi:hypothetical protein PABG_01881 [Paracoccidioides brasiliensis Pb03]|nr:hypothetical protein PABG_01881 [Paracoccidioides brasiliensis Pb03]
MSSIYPDPCKVWSEFVPTYLKYHRSGNTSEATVQLVETANAALPFSKASTILDVGCGGGQIVNYIMERYNTVLPENARIVALDFVEGMVNLVREQQRDHINRGDAVWGQLETAELDATDLSSIKDGECSHVLAGFVYSGIPDSAKAIKEAHRILQDGGIVALTNMRDAEWLDLLQVVKEIRQDLPETPTAESFAPTWFEDAGTKAHLENAGFRDVEIRRIPIHYGAKSYQDLRGKLFDTVPFMPKWLKQMSEEEIERAKDLLVERVSKVHTSEPIALFGTATLAIGRK